MGTNYREPDAVVMAAPAAALEPEEGIVVAAEAVEVTPEIAEVATAAAEEEAAVLGVAINTRNYRALLFQQQQQQSAMRTTNATTAATTTTTTAGSSSASSETLSAASKTPSETSPTDDDAVVGLPVATRNYMALIGDPKVLLQQQQQQHQHQHQQQRASDHRKGSPSPASNQTEDDDAVLGLPISTGNYMAMYRADGTQSVRQRGYSELAAPARDPTGERRATTTAVDHAMGSTGARSRPRESCFDSRRTSGAVVPHKGYLYIQSPTLKSWKRYYAVLSGLDFRYSVERGRAPKGFGLLQAIRRWDDKPFGLKLTYSSGKEVPVYCVGDAEREEWLDAVNRALEKRHTSTGHSKTSYTLTAAEQHDGYLFKQERGNKAWRAAFFAIRNDGYLQCKEEENGAVDARSSGYVKSVAFADVHPNGLAIQLDTGNSVYVYAESYDDRMLWYAAISASASANDRTPHNATSVKSSYVQTARANYAGWVFKQMGLFKAWKRVYLSLHGLEIGYARDANSPLDECDRVEAVEEWDGRQHGLEIRLRSGQVWRVHAESYETAKHWRNVIGDACRHADLVNMKRYLASRKRKNLPPVFGGWLTTTRGGLRIRQFYVMDGAMLGVADDVDNLLQPIGSVVDIGATRDTANGMLLAFADGSRLKVAGDSVESAKSWYECVSSAI